MSSAARDVVMIPCWRRPEFLWHCLDNLARAEGIEQLHVLFRADTGFDPAILEVVQEFAPKLGSHEVNTPVPCPYRRTKQSANLLGGYLMAAAATRRYVFMVEEDVIVARDFFRWHYGVQASQPRLFCSIAARNTNRAVPPGDDPEIYYLTSGDYCSLGLCFERSVISETIAPHVTRKYFANPRRYCERHFPDSRIGAGYVEQDGLDSAPPGARRRRASHCLSLPPARLSRRLFWLPSAWCARGDARRAHPPSRRGYL